MGRIVLIDMVALGAAQWAHQDRMPNLKALARRGQICRAKPVFPPLTLPVQATLTTGVEPERHGIVANGFYFPGDLRVSFWDRWFCYPWWEGRAKEPDFAGRIDIHRKPGYDPLELLLEPGVLRIAGDPFLIRGSHGVPAESAADYPLLITVPEIPGLPQELDLKMLCPLMESILLGERKIEGLRAHG